MQSTIVHEWFYEGGPETYEYLLPCRDVDPRHAKHLGGWIGQFATCDPRAAAGELAGYLDSIETAEISKFTQLFRDLVPASVVVHQDHAWLCCKSGQLLADPSAAGGILLPPPNETPHWPRELSGNAFGPLRHLMRCFGGLRLDIPPTYGLMFPEHMVPAIEDEQTFCWKNIRSWEGAFPVFNVGDGDTVLVRPDGRYGRWDHEMTNPAFVERMIRLHGMTRPDDGAVVLIGDFADLVEYLIDATG